MMNSEKLVKLLGGLLVGLVLAPQAAGAQTQGRQIAVIDEQRILQDSVPGKRQLEAIDALQEQRRNQLKAMETEVLKLQEQLKSMGFSIADEERTRLQRQMEDKVIEAQRFKKDAEREVQSQIEDILRELEKLSKPVIEQVGRERGIELIFSRSAPGLIYVDPSLDITSDVITRLNAGGGAR